MFSVPPRDGKYPVILSYGPYAKGLSFQQGYSGSWDIMVAEHPDVPYGSTNKYQNWEVVDPEKWVRKAMWSFASIHEDAAALLASSTTGRRAKLRTCINASSGLRSSRGLPAKLA